MREKIIWKVGLTGVLFVVSVFIGFAGKNAEVQLIATWVELFSGLFFILFLLDKILPKGEDEKDLKGSSVTLTITPETLKDDDPPKIGDTVRLSGLTLEVSESGRRTWRAAHAQRV